MINRWLNWLNYLILMVIGLLVLGILHFWFNQSNDVVLVDPKSKQSGLPKGAFELSEEAYVAIAGPFLALETAPPSLQLPDLKSQLVYHGRNGRPDAQTLNPKLHFALASNPKKVIQVNPKEKVYLAFDKSSRPPRYQFSPDNEKTALWFEPSLADNNEILVRVTMEDEKGEKITQPESHAQLRMAEKDFVKTGEIWEIGNFRVDGTLLARLRTRWFGPDRFLERHGGKEYETIARKQRLDFGENDDLYYLFVDLGDCLVWDQNRWRNVLPGEDTLNYPLLVVKKIDDRLMSFELWDVNGRGKVALNLLKSNEPWAPNHTQIINQAFKFVGARTRTQFLFEINKERMVIRASDWLLMTPKGWKKLDTAEDIDKFVQRKITGMLFVFEGWAKKDDRQVMLGTLYNPSRCDSQTIELVAQNAKPKGPVKKAKEIDEDDDDEDEDDGVLQKMITSLKQNKEVIQGKTPEQVKKEAQGKQKGQVKQNSAKKNPVSPKNQKK